VYCYCEEMASSVRESLDPQKGPKMISSLEEKWKETKRKVEEGFTKVGRRVFVEG
jgi:hypothetical protein